MESVEAVVVGDGDVSAGLQQNRQHVVPLLADGVVERRVSLRVLQRAQGSMYPLDRELAYKSESRRNMMVPVPSLARFTWRLGWQPRSSSVFTTCR